MNEKIAIRKDKKLTELAKKIFGDIVVMAYVTTYVYSCDNADIISRLNAESFDNDKSSYIDYGAQKILIKFTNGKIVEFENSEWATIDTANDEYYES